MTREEAKEILTHNWTRVDNPNYSESELDEAFFMAIEALNEANKREQYGQNYEADGFVKLGVTDKNKDKVILYDAFGEKEYYPQTDLVRCKDCVWSKEWNDNQIFCDRILMRLRETDFCSYGERREK